jgi:GTP-binding protein EngB required for normal cell division
VTVRFEEILARHRARLAEAQRHAAVLGLGDRFDPLIDESLRTEFRVAVLGRFKAGKSTVINALIGQRIVPSDDLPCTSALIEIRRGESLTFFEEVSGSRLRRARKTFLSSAGAAAERDEGVPRWSIEVPSMSLPSGLVLVDTPGFDENTARSEAAEAELARADAALYVVDANQVGESHDRKAINGLQERVGLVVVLLNRVDELPASGRERVLAFARKRFGGYGLPPGRFLLLSAEGALDGDADAVALMSQARDVISDVLLANTAGLRLQALLGNVRSLTRSLEPEIAKRIVEMERDELEIQQARQTAQVEHDALKAGLRTIRTEAKLCGEAAASDVRDAMNSSWPNIVGKACGGRTYWSTGDLSLWNVESFARSVADRARVAIVGEANSFLLRVVNPIITRKVDELHERVAPAIRDVLGAPGRDRDLGFFEEELARRVKAAVAGEVSSNTDIAATAAAAAAISSLISTVIGSGITVIIAGVITSILIPPVFVAIAATVSVTALFMGTDAVKRLVRDKIAEVLSERLCEYDAQRRVANGASEATKNLFDRLGKTYATQLEGLVGELNAEVKLRAAEADAKFAARRLALNAAADARRALDDCAASLRADQKRVEAFRASSVA